MDYTTGLQTNFGSPLVLWVSIIFPGGMMFWIRTRSLWRYLLLTGLLLAPGVIDGEEPIDPSADAPQAEAETDAENDATADAIEEDDIATDEDTSENDEVDNLPDDKQDEDNQVDGKQDGSQKVDREYFELFKLFADTIDQIERNYVKPVDRRQLVEAAIRGLTAELDPYSSYIPPDSIDHFRNNIDSEFGGIGIQVSLEHGQLTIISPLVGTPAYRGGLLAGDLIIAIEEETTEGMSLDDAVRRMKGKIGTEVSLSVRHADGEEQTVKLKRELIRIETVLGDVRNDADEWNFLLDEKDKLGYIRLTAFSRHTARELRRSLEQLQSQGCRGLVLDLRFNPGGLLSSAVEVSDMFIASGVIVSTEGRNTPKRVWKAHQAGTFDGFRLAILANRFSASASEIVAACLQDHASAVVIGERTWGKGSVQNVVELEDGKSALKLTTASYQRPSGKNIHRFYGASRDDDWGVYPDDGFLVDWDAKQTRGYLEYRRNRDIVLGRIDGSDDETSAADAEQESEPAESTVPDTSSEQTKEPGDEQGADDKPSDPADEEVADSDATDGEFVDGQLQMALDYLRKQLAEVAQK